MQYLKKGELVMVPLWGLSEVTGHSREKILGKICEFCHIRPHKLDEPIKYTYQTVQELGIRPLMSEVQLHSLSQQQVVTEALQKMPGTRRYQRWLRILRSGRPGAHQRILSEMACVQNSGARLLTREVDLRKTVERNFRAEVSAVLRCSAQNAAAFVRQTYHLTG